MSLTIFIDGASGTTGLEIADRLAGRDEFTQIVLDEKERKERSARRDALNAADVAILCLPDDAAREAVALLAPESSTRVIDASSAHRTADGWTYGFPELVGREALANARRISNPGCYPTGFLALITPLVRAGCLPDDWPYTVNAVSGYSGGGKALIQRFDEHPDIAFRAYGLSLDHKHLSEMQQYAALRYPPVFSPGVVPAMRGMIVDVPISREAIPRCGSPSVLLACLQDYYADAALIQVHPASDNPQEILLHRHQQPWDGMDLFVFHNSQATQLRLVARLDNLGKGASGAVVQTLNLMAGINEYAGLHLRN